MTEGFLSAHPDLRWRREGLHAYANKRYDEAMSYFLRAARYADKPAQAMIAQMYWNGVGIALTRVGLRLDGPTRALLSEPFDPA